MNKKLIVNYKDKRIASKWLLPQVFNYAAIQLATTDTIPDVLQVGDKIQITATVCEGKIEVWVMTNEDIE